MAAQDDYISADYMTVAKRAAAEFTERRSRFLSAIEPVSSEAEAQEKIAAVKKEYWDARHTVYAYVLRDGQTRRYSDDGEPQGTAGLPVLEVLERRGLTDCLITVTRYFGGILLGTGGLTRAYSHAAALAVEAVKPVRMRRCVQVRIRCDYAAYGWLSPLLLTCGQVCGSDFADEVVLSALIPRDTFLQAERQITEQSAGRLKPEVLGEVMAAFPDETSPA
ncbi:MAG: YigZ family protein [Clostridia bacterium]|nr:YigZ family protein [Clostridia bacterium]